MAGVVSKYYYSVVKILKQGTDPNKLSMAIAVGITIGTFPVIGPTTALCFLLAWVFRVNAAAAQLANYATYPLQIICMIPIYKTASYFSGVGFDMEMFSSVSGISEALGLFQQFGVLIGYAIGVWMLLAFPFGYLIYLISKVFLKKLAKRVQPEKTVIIGPGIAQ